MEELLKEELDGSVFEHSLFSDEFLERDDAIQREVRDRILATPGYSTADLQYHANTGYWSLSDTIAKQINEKEVYSPLVTILNIIGRAAFDIYYRRHPNDTFRPEYRPFLDHGESTTLRDSPSDAATKSSTDGHRSHWANVEMVMECKSRSDTNSIHQALLQIARYARQVFIHQLYRNRVFGFVLCGSIVIFVCFDRSGMVHSPKIDLPTPDGANKFVRYMIALTTISPEKAGYDTRYSIDYGANPPNVLFEFPGHPPEVVNEILCHRKCICGRATCMCGLGDKVHKSIWRPADGTDEGETLAQFENVFGVCQMAAHHSGTYSTKLNYSQGIKHSPYAGYFSPTASACRSIQSISTASSHPSAPGAAPTTIQRGVREKSDILMPQGVPLMEAQSPLHLLVAVHDALMGIMAFTEAGKIHCDISAFNLLLVDPKKHYASQNWLGSPKVQAIPDVWMRRARDPHKGVSGPVGIELMNSPHYESPRLRRVKTLNRGPYCVVHDTEFAIDEDRTRSQVRAVCTGTPAFISGQLLLSSSQSEPAIAHSFIHDVESLFWVLMWIVIRRSQNPDGPWEVNDVAKKLMRQLSNSAKDDLGAFKAGVFKDSAAGDLERTILGLKNDWSEALAPVIVDFADFFYESLYFNRASGKDYVRLKNQYLDEPREKTFERLFGILDAGIEDLRKTYPEPDLELLLL